MELANSCIWHVIKLEARQLSEAGGGPKPNVFYMHSAILFFYLLHVLKCKSTECNPQCGYTMEAYVISHQHSSFDIDSSCRSLMGILRKSFICVNLSASLLSLARAHLPVGGVLLLMVKCLGRPYHGLQTHQFLASILAPFDNANLPDGCPLKWFQCHVRSCAGSPVSSCTWFIAELHLNLHGYPDLPWMSKIKRKYSQQTKQLHQLGCDKTLGTRS